MDAWRPLADCIDELAPKVLPETTRAEPADQGLPWERRAEVGFFSALLETVRLVLLEPTAAFTAMKPSGGYGAPLFFAVILGSVGWLADLGYFLALQDGPMLHGFKGAPEAGTLGAAVGMMIVLIPVLTTVSTFVSSAAYHFLLIIVGGAHKPYQATFRVTCYCAGATWFLRLMPGCGFFLSWILFVVCLSVGLSIVQGIGRGRAGVAVLAATILMAAIYFAAMAAAVSSMTTPAEIEALKRAVLQA